MARLHRILQTPIPTNPRPTLLALILAIPLYVRVSVALPILRKVLMPTRWARPLVRRKHAEMRVVLDIRAQPVIHGLRRPNIPNVVIPKLPLRLPITAKRRVSNIRVVLIGLRLHTKPLTQRIKRVALKVELLARNLQRVHRFPRRWWRPPILQPPTTQMLLIETAHVVAHNNVGFVKPIPRGTHEPYVPVFPFGGEHDLRFVVPLRGSTD